MLRRLRQLLFPAQEFADSDEESRAAYLPREKFMVLGISFVLAFCLWFIVNLSRDFHITINLPLQVVNLPDNMALINEPPKNASVGVMGEGWKLISLYNNPPAIQVDVLAEETNLFENVRRQVSIISDVNITKVQPLVLNLALEEKMQKRVPVESQVQLELRSRHSLAHEPRIEPDSVTLSGAGSHLEEIDRVVTRPVSLKDVDEPGELQLEVIPPVPGVTVSPESVRFLYEVTEFTEGELRIPVRIRNLPPGRAVTYNPSSVTIRYDVPLDQYAEVQNRRPFIAWIDYNDILSDTTGTVIPKIESSDEQYDIRLRSFQPRTLSYFIVLPENQ